MQTNPTTLTSLLSAVGATTTITESSTGSNNNNNNLTDARYYYNVDDLNQLKNEKPWMKNPKYFQKVALSPSAIMKMMMHCQSGVEKGISKGGNPIEVMGLLLGRPDPVTPTTLVVTDAFPLPIEGFETRVVADDENVHNHMIALGESLERSRNEKFMGWYHSHPFDYIPTVQHNHCFLSQTDLSTQLQWQRHEDPHGNPFVAIVIDPIRSTVKNNPEIKAFRAYPPEYNSPVTNECPDGTIEPIEQIRLEKWGSCWNRYYQLNVEYFMSQTSRKVLEALTQDYLWIRNLQSKPPIQVTEQLTTCCKQFQHAATTKTISSSTTKQATTIVGGGGMMSSTSSSREVPPTMMTGATRGASGFGRATSRGGGGEGGTSLGGRTGSTGSGSAGPELSTTTTIEAGAVAAGTTGTTTGAGKNTSSITNNPKSIEWNKSIHQLSDIATEQLAEMTLQTTKKTIFS